MKTIELVNLLGDSELSKIALEHPQDLIDICLMLTIEIQSDKENLTILT
jgi:hypothetical protein